MNKTSHSKPRSVCIDDESHTRIFHASQFCFLSFSFSYHTMCLCRFPFLWLHKRHTDQNKNAKVAKQHGPTFISQIHHSQSHQVYGYTTQQMYAPLNSHQHTLTHTNTQMRDETSEKHEITDWLKVPIGNGLLCSCLYRESETLRTRMHCAWKQFCWKMCIGRRAICLEHAVLPKGMGEFNSVGWAGERYFAIICATANTNI